jgi:hypothetical protein
MAFGDQLQEFSLPRREAERGGAAGVLAQGVCNMRLQQRGRGLVPAGERLAGLARKTRACARCPAAREAA